MKVLSLGIDSEILNKKSKSAGRMVEYGELVERYDIVVPSEEKRVVELSEKVRVFGIEGCCKVVKFFRIYVKLSEIVKKNKYDVVTVQDPFELAFLGWLMSKRFGMGLNIQSHGDSFSGNYWRNESIRNFFRYYLGKFLVKRADSLRVVSQRIKRNFVDDLGVDTRKIVVVPMYTDVFVSNEKKERGGRFVFLWLGRFDKAKNLVMLLRSFKEVVKKEKRAVLRLIGRGSEKRKIEGLVKELGIGENVEILDWVNDVDSEYRRADAYVLSSNYEGWGRVVVEAMMNNLPVVMTRVGCADEFVRDGENGIVVDVENEEGLVDGMVRMMDDGLRGRFRSNFEKAFDRLLSKDETLRLYKKSWELAVRNK